MIPSLEPVINPGVLEGIIHVAATESNGVVNKIAVEVGQKITFDQEILQVDDSDLSLSVNQAQSEVILAQKQFDELKNRPDPAEVALAEASLSGARADLKSAEATNNMLLSSYKYSTPPKADSNSALSAIEIAKAEVALAQSKLDQVKAIPTSEEAAILQAKIGETQSNLRLTELLKARCTLRSPVDGVVSKVAIRSGEVATAGESLVEIMDSSILQLAIDLPEYEIVLLNWGSELVVEIQGETNTQLTGKITRIAPQGSKPVETLLQHFRVMVSVDNRDNRFHPGMPAVVLIGDKRYGKQP